MSKFNRGSFGVVIAVGGALAITTAYSGNSVLAVVIGVLTVLAAVGVYVKVDRGRS